LSAYQTQILGSRHFYYHLASSQWFELRLCPALAFGLLTASWLVLLFKRNRPVPLAKALLAAGLGPLGFGLLRLFFVAPFRDRLVWFDVWEELTELLFIFSAAVVVWVFRQALLPSLVSAKAQSAAAAAAEAAGVASHR
jgi:hypothetical protein